MRAWILRSLKIKASVYHVLLNGINQTLIPNTGIYNSMKYIIVVLKLGIKSSKRKTSCPQYL